INPWVLFARAHAVYTVSSQLGFEALMAGVKVVSYGAPFYAGWGLSDARIAVPRRTARPSLDDLVAAVYLRYSRYFDPWTRQSIDCLTAIEHLDFLRRHYFGNSSPVVCYGIARWKRRAVAAMLDGPRGKPLFTNNRATAVNAAKARRAAIAARRSSA